MGEVCRGLVCLAANRRVQKAALFHRRHQEAPPGAAVVGFHQRHIVSCGGNRPPGSLADKVKLANPRDVRDRFPGFTSIGGLLDLKCDCPSSAWGEEIQRVTRGACSTPGATTILGSVNVLGIGNCWPTKIGAAHLHDSQFITEEAQIIRTARQVLVAEQVWRARRPR